MDNNKIRLVCTGIPKWECGSPHPLGCYEWNGVFYYNHLEGNIQDPSMGTSKGHTSGGFDTCGLINFVAHMAIKEHEVATEDKGLCEDEPRESVSFAIYQKCKTYGKKDTVVHDGLIYVSNKCDNSDHPQAGTGKEVPTWSGGFEFDGYIKFVTGAC